MSACKHGWASENYVKCSRCYEEARHAVEAATLTARIGSLEATLREILHQFAVHGRPHEHSPWHLAAERALSASPEVKPTGEGHRAGAEWMREQAADLAEYEGDTFTARKIRSLPVSPPAPEEDK